MIRTPGRPRLDDDDSSVPVTVRVPSKQYDKMIAAADRDRVTVAEWIRRHTKDSDRSK
jgi:hypothetical protein